MEPNQGRSDPAPNIVMAARALAPGIMAVQAAAERDRCIPGHLADAIAQHGLYQMFLPRSAGGPELSPLTAARAVEEISRADGSVGWCTMIATDISLFMGWLTPQVTREICGTPPDLRAAGSLRPQGRAWPVDGGYRVRGQWNFASGIRNANWLYAPCVIMQGDKPQMTQAGTPRIRAVWLPVSQATIEETWSVIGMRGTGSEDFVVDDVIVPEAFSCFVGEPAMEQGPLYQPRGMLTIVWAVTAANAIGIARGAIERFVEMAASEASTQSTALLRDRPHVQSRLAQAEAIVNAARAYLYDAVARAWEALCAGGGDPSQEIAQARLAITHAIHESTRAVDLVFHAAGTNAIFTRHPIERHFRDIHVVTQHNSAFPAHYEAAGKVLMGLRPTDPGW